MDEATVKSEVRQKYAAVARGGGYCCASSDCCSQEGAEMARLVDYGALRQEIVESADLGLGCGMPTRFADLKPGEVVLDLGSGGGVDVFLAAEAVGPEGRVIGVDMTPEMIARARENAFRGRYANVEFRLGEIEALPVADVSVDVVLSNCVINLVPDKARVFSEIHRVLRSGGRFCISDIVSYGRVPKEVRRDGELWAGCIAGAMDKDEYLRLIEESGFGEVRVHHLEDYSQFLGSGYGFASITVEGVKP